MRIALGQFAASPDWSDNLRTSLQYLDQAAAGDADLLVLPEGVLARFTEDRGQIRQAAQPLDGPFVSGLVGATRSVQTTVVVGVHEPAPDGRVFNTLAVARGGELIARYRKLHLYDAFDAQESEHVAPGDDEPVVFDCAGLTVGLMTCYDVRFPEMARLLADAGAEVIALPAAWVRGPLKEHHWATLVTARALDNTCYVAAAGECGVRNIGASMLVDPLGVAVARLGEQPQLLWGSVDPDRLRLARQRLPVLENRRFRIDPHVLPIQSRVPVHA